MNCEKYQEILNAFFDGERTDPAVGEAFNHLYTCEECKTFWKEIIDFREMALNDTISYPAAIDRRIYGLSRHERKSPSFEFHVRMPRFAFGTLALLLLALAFAAGYFINEKAAERAMTVQTPEYALPARVVYVYTIPGSTVYANDIIPKNPRELKP